MELFKVGKVSTETMGSMSSQMEGITFKLK